MMPGGKVRNEKQYNFQQPVGNINLNNSLKSNTDSSYEVKRSYQTINISKFNDSFPNEKKYIQKKT